MSRELLSTVSSVSQLAHPPLPLSCPTPPFVFFTPRPKAAGVARELLTRAKAHVAAARAAQAEQIEAKKRLGELSAAAPLEMDITAARAAADAARGVGVKEGLVAAALVKMEVAAAAQAAREAAAAVLEAASSAGLLLVDVGGARAALKAASAAGVRKELLGVAKGKVDAAEKAQSERAAASQEMEKIVGEPLLNVNVEEVTRKVEAAR